MHRQIQKQKLDNQLDKVVLLKNHLYWFKELAALIGISQAVYEEAAREIRKTEAEVEEAEAAFAVLLKNYHSIS